MSAKHTPGPWDVVVRGWRSTFTITHPPFGVLGEVAEVYQEADARLIAAAPDLLEALREAVIEIASVAGAVTPTTDMVINAHDCLKRAMAAIAKAEGRTE